VLDSGWLRAGDVGFVDVDGFLTISDRAKDMIISGGENTYAAEVEQIIMELAEAAWVAAGMQRLDRSQGPPANWDARRRFRQPGSNSRPS
jgi:acyl-CoA synthetase (AMP-forming)/AMP-acid ligase II